MHQKYVYLGEGVSPTLMRFSRYRVVIHTRDHGPPHIHILSPDAEMVVDIVKWEITALRGFSWPTAQRVLILLRPEAQDFLNAWKKIHEKEE